MRTIPFATGEKLVEYFLHGGESVDALAVPVRKVARVHGARQIDQQE